MIFSELKLWFKNEISELYSYSEISQLFIIFSEEILNLDRFQQRISENILISENAFSLFKTIINQLKMGKPYQQILGKSEFFRHTFFVNENVLIPRPETEELLELAIAKIKETKFKNQKINILDIGTGSGIIPIILKKHFPQSSITAIDISEEALLVARKNAKFHKVEINFQQSNYLSDNLENTFDIMISNPPYIGQNETEEIANSVKNFEPNNALFSPSKDPLIFYRKIAHDSKNHLSKNGILFLEINQRLGIQTLDLFKNKFKYSELIKDLSNNDRFIFASKN